MEEMQEVKNYHQVGKAHMYCSERRLYWVNIPAILSGKNIGISLERLDITAGFVFAS